MEERIYITKNTEHHQSRKRFLSILREYPLHDKGRSCPWATFSLRSVVVIQDFGLAEGSFIARGPCIKYQFWSSYDVFTASSG